ncbi:MAG: hypothetical protein ACYTF1_04460 [Planctomycetota bacterium]
MFEKTIMVVDNNQDNLDLIEEYLEDTTYSVLQVTSEPVTCPQERVQVVC